MAAFLFGGDWEGAVGKHAAELDRHLFKQACNPIEFRTGGASIAIKIAAAINLQLDCMNAQFWAAMPRDNRSARIRHIQRRTVTFRTHNPCNLGGEPAGCAAAIPVPDHDIRILRGPRRHGMTVDQRHLAKPRCHFD